jgi:hypothetical protein
MRSRCRQHPHRRGNGLLELVVVELEGFADESHVRNHVDRAEIAHRDLVVIGVERDLGAKVRAVHHAHVLLGRAQIAGILESDPRMPGLEEHRQHLAPQLCRSDLPV